MLKEIELCFGMILKASLEESILLDC